METHFHTSHWHTLEEANKNHGTHPVLTMFLFKVVLIKAWTNMKDNAWVCRVFFHLFVLLKRYL